MVNHPDLMFEKILGKGGYGEVGLYHQKGYDFPIAIKTLLKPNDQYAKARFEEEIRIAKRLKSFPYVVDIHWEGIIGGVQCYAMKYYGEGNLRSKIPTYLYLEKNKVSDLIITLAYGLHAIHYHGIIHRDLKPDNILFDNSGPKIADWGLGKRYLERNNTLTAGQGIGTEVYAAPEQKEGRYSDHRSDIYSLGVIYRELLTGSRDGYIKDKRLRKVITKMTSNSPQERQQSMNEVATEIENALFFKNAINIGGNILKGLGATIVGTGVAFGVAELVKLWNVEE